MKTDRSMHLMSNAIRCHARILRFFCLCFLKRIMSFNHATTCQKMAGPGYVHYDIFTCGRNLVLFGFVSMMHFILSFLSRFSNHFLFVCSGVYLVPNTNEHILAKSETRRGGDYFPFSYCLDIWHVIHMVHSQSKHAKLFLHVSNIIILMVTSTA